MAADKPELQAISAFITDAAVRGQVLAYAQKIDDTPLVMLEIMPRAGAGVRHMILQISLADARLLGTKLLALTGGPGDQHGA